MKVFFLVPYPTEGASNRIRVEQYLPYLKSKGVSYKVRPFANRRFYKILYLPHRHIEKIFWFSICTLNRMMDIVRSAGYDIIFIHREAYPLGGAFIERILSAMGKRIIYDFDDAVFLPNTSRYNSYIEKLKKPGKTADIIRMSSLVIAGNNYLKDYALKYNKNVYLIPSTVDTDRCRPGDGGNGKKDIVIGWIGSNTTKDFLSYMEEIFVKLSDKYNNVVFKIVGPSFRSTRLKNIINKPWSLEGEADDMRSFDIGIMPMPDNEWTRGKCAFKALLYMSYGLPAVSSAVGMNLEVVEDGVDGFLAHNRDEWIKGLSALIEDGNLRKTMGQRGRQKIEKGYSVRSMAPLFHKVLEKAYKA